MTNWVDLVAGAAPLTVILGATAPTLAGINLHEINLHRDGPRVLLRFDLQDYPADPPKKWSSSGFNRVQIRLLASGVQTLQMAGLQSNMKLD